MATALLLTARSVTARYAIQYDTLSVTAPNSVGALLALGLVVGNGGLDRIFGQYRAMDLDRRQGQFLGDVGVLDQGRFIQRLALDPFGHQRRRGNRRTATIGLELGIFDATVLANLDLQFHHVAAGRRADHAGTDIVIILVERTDVTRMLVVVNHLVAVSHGRPRKTQFSLLQRPFSAPPTRPWKDRRRLCTFPGTAA